MAALFVVTLVMRVAAADSVQLEEKGGVFTVPVQINGVLTLNFLVDSGASDVVLPADVVLALTRTGSIKPTDYLGTGTYQLANGAMVKNKKVVLQTVAVGSTVVSDVESSIAPAKGEPLLGQSFLSRMPSWTMDNAHHVLVIGRDSAPGTLASDFAATSPQDAYASAMRLLTRADYAAAGRAMQAFLDHWPNDPLAGSAQYWIGEVHYVQGDYAGAAKAFAKSYERYPNSSKAADSLLKLGISLTAQDRIVDACKAYARLSVDFPLPAPTLRDRLAAEQLRAGC